MLEIVLNPIVQVQVQCFLQPMRSNLRMGCHADTLCNSEIQGQVYDVANRCGGHLGSPRPVVSVRSAACLDDGVTIA